MNPLDQLVAEELRNAAGTPWRFQLLDFLGVALGTYFVWEGWSRSNVNVALGAIMIFIHSQRFFYAPQTAIEPK